MDSAIALASSRLVGASINVKPEVAELRFVSFGPSSNHWSVTGAGLKAVSYTHLTLPTILRV